MIHRNALRLLSLIATPLLLGGCAVFQSPPAPTSMEERLSLLDQLPKADLQGNVTIHWNEKMIPFIEAEHDVDAAFALGLIHAHLRISSMEIGKYLAAGRISEMVGPLGQDVDAALRALGINRAIPEMMANMPKDTHDWLSAFTHGVNHYKKHSDIPHDLKILNIGHEVWRIEDTLSLGRLGGVDVNWLSILSLLPSRDDPGWNDLWSRMNETLDQKASRPQIHPTRNAQRLASVSKKPQTVFGLKQLSRMVSGYARSGSNSFAVAAHRSTNGAPMIANDPHLGFFIPNFWLIAGVKSPSYHMVGMMPTGIPVMGFGRNEHMAWGGTNMRHEASDLVDVTDLPKDNWPVERHEIKDRFLWDRVAQNRISPYGPVISDAALFPKFKKDAHLLSDKIFAMRWVGHLPSDEVSALLGVAKSTNWQEMQSAIDDFSIPGQNFIFAEKDGTVGLLLGAWLPERPYEFPKDLWRTPDNSDRAFETIRTSSALPRLIAPETGTIASGNNKPFEPQDFRISWFFSPNDRAHRIYQRLEEQDLWDVDGLKEIQRDVYSASHVALRNRVMELAQDLPLTARQASLIGHLRDWDGHFKSHSRNAYLYHIWLLDFASRYYSETEYDLWRKSSYLPHRLLRDLHDDEDLQGLRQILLDSLLAVGTLVDKGTAWGDIHRIRVRHVMANLPLTGKRYDFGDYPVAGYRETVMKTSGALTSDTHYTSFGAQARHISDLSDINANYFILFGGQDGMINAENSLDQVDAFLKGDYIQVPFEIDKVKDEFIHKTHLH